MTNILCLETATEVCSVAIAVDGKIIDFRETSDQNSHSEKITLFIEELLRANSFALNDINAIAISMGPGSYTGLRIGTSTAKGICYALDIPLIALSTLEIIANGALKESTSTQSLIMPMIDARRMEVYMALFDSKLNVVEATKAQVMDADFCKSIPSQQLVLCGNGVEKCTELFKDYANVVFAHSSSSARFMGDLAMEKYTKSQFEDVAYFEPYYLKDFIAAPSYVKGLR